MTEMSDTPAAPSLADDVTKIRAELLVPAWEADEIGRQDAIAALDRIVAQVPQRAVGPYDMPLWQHECGWPVQDTAGSKHCPRCGYSTEDGWQALYTLGGES